MIDSEIFDPRYDLAINFLERHFGSVLRLKFLGLDGEPMPPHEVFHQDMMLYPIAMGANELSNLMFGRRLVVDLVESKEALFGYRVTLDRDLGALDLMMMVAVAEELFEMYAPGCLSGEESTVDLTKIIDDFFHYETTKTSAKAIASVMQ